ncbi:MAG: hypothetical protein U9N04_00710 [Patescibacteria group bacterium]|nr:hypothetical protein [Patescibacteria group bacterium]
MEKKNNKMTLEKLAEMTQRGFRALEDGFKKEIKGEIGGLRKEMKGEIGGLKGEIGGLKGEIGGLKSRMDEMDGKFNKLLTGQDQVLKRLVDLETDNTMDVAVHRRQEDKLENHEERIIIVEKELKIDSVV